MLVRPSRLLGRRGRIVPSTAAGGARTCLHVDGLDRPVALHDAPHLVHVLLIGKAGAEIHALVQSLRDSCGMAGQLCYVCVMQHHAMKMAAVHVT